MIADNKLNPIENRHEKEFFVKTCKTEIEDGLWFSQMQKHRDREIPMDIVRELKSLGYQKHVESIDSHSETIELWLGSIRDLCGKDDQVIYQREISIAEGTYAEISILYDAEYSCLRFSVNDTFETSFSLNIAQESSRFLAGLVAVTDKNKLFYTIEETAGYSSQDRALRVILKDPLTCVKHLDLVLAEPHIVDIHAEFSPVTSKDVPVYRLKEELRYSFTSGFRDCFALFKKIPEIVIDFKQAFISTQERLRIEPIID